MTQENEFKPCPCCENNPEALMIHVGIGWKCTVCSYMEIEPSLEDVESLDD